MADRYLLESSPTDGYLLEDGSGVLLLDMATTTRVTHDPVEALTVDTAPTNRVTHTPVEALTVDTLPTNRVTHIWVEALMPTFEGGAMFVLPGLGGFSSLSEN